MPLPKNVILALLKSPPPPPLILLLNCSGGIILKMKMKGKQQKPGFPKFPSYFPLFALVNSDFLIKIPFPAIRLLHNLGMFAGSEPFICLVAWLWDGRRISCVCLCVFPCIKSSLFTPAMTQKLNLCTLLLVSFPYYFKPLCPEDQVISIWNIQVYLSV